MFRRDLLFLNFLIFDWLAASRARDSFRANIPWLFESSPPAASFDKEYNERTGQLYFKDTHIAEMLRLGRSQVEVSIRTVMMTDSLEMTDADRNLIVQNCLQSAEDRIVITHGTDTMTETAAAVAGAVTGKTVVLTGAMIPYAFGSSDGLFNLGSALSFVQALPPGVYIAIHGQCFPWDRVRKTASAASSRKFRRAKR